MFRNLFYLFFFLSASAVYCQIQWHSRSRLMDFDKYYRNVIQETVYEVEKRGWSSLRFNDNITQTLGEVLYDWHFNGSVTYTNGFLVSVQQLQVTNTQQFINNRTLPDNSTALFAGVQGRFFMRDTRVGFDVYVQLLNEDKPQWYTGIYNHQTVEFSLTIQKNLRTNEMSTSSTLQSLSAGIGNRMVYMPANNVTEALSRVYVPSNNWNGIRDWGTAVFAPIMLDIAKNHIAFPKFCLGC
ncbi:uncharacterized protein LOC113513701 [Galleria mellonella]|uniref:Uncharacterized protein LOC113513701 n=1 Tax=Galleria mellonella TaxID=7137 RepID=A0A6J1WH58_GALME|nr:uncharacterized protein LOC113513701 [Galleria mellonella]